MKPLTPYLSQEYISSKLSSRNIISSRFQGFKRPVWICFVYFCRIIFILIVTAERLLHTVIFSFSIFHSNKIYAQTFLNKKCFPIIPHRHPQSHHRKWPYLKKAFQTSASISFLKNSLLFMRFSLLDQLPRVSDRLVCFKVINKFVAPTEENRSSAIALVIKFIITKKASYIWSSISRCMVFC